MTTLWQPGRLVMRSSKAVSVSTALDVWLKDLWLRVYVHTMPLNKKTPAMDKKHQCHVLVSGETEDKEVKRDIESGVQSLKHLT